MSIPAKDPASALRDALLALRRQQARIQELEAAATQGANAEAEPIAIVGIGCRYPGGVRGPEAFWEKLTAGFDAVGEVPPERWRVDDFYHPDPEHPGTTYTRRGAFVDDVDRFDARFFGISPREAVTMDPQQRLLLETAWEAFEDAGIPPARVAGTATGVYVGLTVIDYLRLVYRDDLARLDAYGATGNVPNIASGRLSYFFGLRGPALTVDTACSSSLTALHLACQGLRTGETTLALAAGVNLILAPDNTVAVSRARMLAPDGRCKTFDASADGYARGEGCGVVILKRLSRAQADGDRIHAVIRATALAQDGARSGLTVPNGPAQSTVIRQALASARLDPAAIGYVEAHGTGTALGDPIEAEALATVFGRDARRTSPLVVGSLKTNVGHMESAAGIGGVIKVALALRHGSIPAHLHFQRENPEVRLGEIPAVVPASLQPWPATPTGRRLAGVSSFGSSGTIAHVILEAPPPPDAAPPWPAGRPYPLFLSARTPAALRRLAARMAAHLRALPADADVASICWTAATARTAFPSRVTVTGPDAATLAAGLERVADAWDSAQPMPADPDLATWFGEWTGRRVVLPTYPFERERHWVEPEPRAASRRRSAVAPAPKPAGGLEFGLMFFNGTERPGGDSYRLLFEAARFGDAHGFSSVWLPERHFTAFGGVYPNPATLHAALARETTRVRLMAGSSVLPLHDLRRLAEEWSVVDNLSGGRAGMSFASGWNPADFSLRPEAYADRQARLFSGIEELRRLWRGEALPASGGDGREVTVRIYPTPVQPELPLWVTAAGNPLTFERAGAVGANLLTHLLDQDVGELAAKIARYRSARAAAGHDPAAGRVTVMVHTFLGSDPASVHARVKGPFTAYLRDNLHLLGGLAASRGRSVEVGTLPEAERAAFVDFLYDRFTATRALLGPPEACAPLVRQLVAAGVNEIACLLDFGPNDDDVLAMLPALASFRAAMVAEGSTGAPVAPTELQPLVEGWHQWGWRSVAWADPSGPIAGRWIIRADAAGFGVALGAWLRARGARVDVVSATGPLEAAPTDRVVDARALAGSSNLLETLELVQRGQGRLWTLTRGAHACGGIAPDVDQAARAALLRVLPVEQPDRWGGLIDLDPSLALTDQVEVVGRVLSGDHGEDQLAVRGTEVRAARLQPLRPEEWPAPATFVPRADVTYLVTGGLSGLGWAVAAWLVERGARHLLLLGRRAPDAAQQAQFERWNAAGVAVSVVSLDLRDRTQLASALAAQQPAVGGLFHAAGAWHDRPLAELTAEDLAVTWQAKVDGARHLDELLPVAAVEPFVLFSAFSALLPAPGQGNYAAANAALDAIAHGRRQRGGVALTINWGPWSEVGFAATDYGRRAHARLESLGIRRYRPTEGLALLERALASGRAQVAAMRVDWRQLFTADPQARLSPLLRDLATAHAPRQVPVAPAEAGRMVRLLAGQPAATQAGLLASALAASVAAVLRMRPDEVPVGTSITELGVDSLVAIEVRNRIQLEAGVEVPLTRLLEGPTCVALADSLLGPIKLAVLAAAPASAGPVEEIEL